MKTKLIIKTALTLVLFASTVTACAQSKTNSKQSLLSEAKATIAKSNSIYFKSSEKNDVSIFLDRYAEDACLLEPGKPIACGMEVLVNFFRHSYEMGVRGGKFTTTEVYGNGTEYVTEIGTGQVWDANKKVMDEFKYMVIWKKTKNGWKMYRDAFSTNWSEEK